MSLKVLQDKVQIKQARRKLQNKGVSFIESPLQFLMRKLKFKPGMAIGDKLKSWDVLLSLDFLENHAQKNEPILDIGCYASELIVALHKLGYSNLTGVDLNENLRKMPYQGSIRYEINNFMETSFADSSFKAITSISVIEHGFCGKLLLKEISRLLEPNGYFIVSFDYWPEKIDTSGIKIYDLDWKIFSREEVISFITEAQGYGLWPIGELMFDAKIKPVACEGKQYTFAWLVLMRRS